MVVGDLVAGVSNSNRAVMVVVSSSGDRSSVGDSSVVQGEVVLAVVVAVSNS